MEKPILKPVSPSQAIQPKIFAIRPVRELIQHIPPTRYYGSKRKLLPWLYDSLKLLEFRTVLDAFGGSGSVSQLFRTMKKEVHYHDALSFNFDIATAVLTDRSSVSLPQLEDFVSLVKPASGTVARVFDGVFFLNDENGWIDGFMRQLSDARLGDADKSLLRYLLYQACLKKRPFNLFHRSNLSVRTKTDVKRSFGNLTTWETSFPDHMKQCLIELINHKGDALPSAHVLSPGDAGDLTPGYDLVYFDPPYVSNQERINRDNYWLRYHFLEGLSQYERWESLIELGSSVKAMREPKHLTEWSRKRVFKEKLFELIKAHRYSIVVLSYVKDAYPDDVTIRQFFEETFSRVTVHSTEHNHALSGSKKRELLFIGIPS